MCYTEWKDKTDGFNKIDVRGIQGNFSQGVKKQAMALPEGAGMEIVQNFDPLPLYEVMEDLGYEHHTEQTGDAEFHVYFYRAQAKQPEKDIPMRPAPLTNMPLVDEKLGNIAVNSCRKAKPRPNITTITPKGWPSLKNLSISATEPSLSGTWRPV